MTLAAGAAQGGVVVDLLLILVAAGVAATLFGRLKLAAIPGYLIAGLLISIFKEPSADIGFVSQLAVILLMFSIGLHLDVSSLRSGAVAMVVAGAGSTALSSALLAGVGMVFGLSLYAALAVGMAMSLSSTAVVLRIIQQKRLLQRVPGRLCFGVLIVQDLAVVVMLALIPMLATLAAPTPADGSADPSSWSAMLLGGLVRGGGLVVFMVVAIKFLPTVLSHAAR
ncbi:MAG: cation:proton antiporter, partial [Planctomycetota bacterium]